MRMMAFSPSPITEFASFPTNCNLKISKKPINHSPKKKVKEMFGVRILSLLFLFWNLFLLIKNLVRYMKKSNNDITNV